MSFAVDMPHLDAPADTAARLIDCTASQYHADPAPEPSLSRSVAHTIVTQSPRHAWLAHPRLGGQTRKRESPEMTRGTIVHELLLNDGANLVAIEAADFRTNAAKEARDAAIFEGKTPVIAAKLEGLRAVASKLSTKLDAMGFALDRGVSEATILWTEDTHHGPMWCRARLDHVRLDEGLILDLKTTEDGHPDACARSMVSYGYDLQNAAYPRAVEALRPELVGRVKMVFLFVELATLEVTAVEADGSMATLGRTRWGRGLTRWAECIATDTWPGYEAGGVVRVEAPPWAMAKEVDQGMSKELPEW